MRLHLLDGFGIVLLLSVTFSWAGYSQSRTIDSLKTAIPYTQDGQLQQDSATIQLLNELGMAYRLVDADSTLKYARLAESLAREADYISEALFARYLQGTSYFYKGQYQKVYDLARTSLEEAGPDRYKRERAYLNQLMGLSYSAQGSYQPGLQYFIDARDLFASLDNELGVFQNMNNIGVSYLKLEDYEEALQIFLQLDSLHTLEASKISIPVNLGFIYYELKEYAKAKEQLNRVLNFEGDGFDQRALALSHFKLGQIYLAEGEYEQALYHFNLSIDEYDQLDNETQKVQSLDGIANTYLQMGDVNQALEIAREAFRIAESYEALPEKNMTAETLTNIYKERGEFETALSYHELHKELSDSLKNEDISRELGRLEAEVEYRKRELELRESQQQQNLENAKQVADRNLYIIIALFLLLIMAVVAYSQYRNSSLRKKANDLLREKNLQIEQQAARLEEMNEIKTHLFSIIAHDLRGPLSSLYGFITLTDMKALSQEEMQEMIPELAAKFKYTSTLLNNLLNWARSQLDGYKVVPTTFDLSEKVEETQKILSPQIQEKEIEVKSQLSSPLKVYADPNMIELVLLNLLSNAVKFTPKQGKIVMSATENADEVVFSIEDTGVGIPEDILHELFEGDSFYSTTGTNNEKGTGLGLMLCKDFVRKNKGRIFAESEVGEGSTFFFTLPAGKIS
ncbi:tetratricopeptide repeat-containing sensor histidine kinase [Gracilimonas mengyeensis]|uniref:histidine kinase n=1 Tax=Gracilimonas mengyeensis TaxID=1302730 RepID=A0A521BB61_9BACT|nr:ATP-binding protein [Gracilimonas mengyeensis]SMO44313.1 Tetratricopeptide repeat-containing protein [Gracilimonas mengyeensis]